MLPVKKGASRIMFSNIEFFIKSMISDYDGLTHLVCSAESDGRRIICFNIESEAFLKSILDSVGCSIGFFMKSLNITEETKISGKRVPNPDYNPNDDFSSRDWIWSEWSLK